MQLFLPTTGAILAYSFLAGVLVRTAWQREHVLNLVWLTGENVGILGLEAKRPTVPGNRPPLVPNRSGSSDYNDGTGRALMTILATRGKPVFFLLLASSFLIGERSDRALAQLCGSAAVSGKQTCCSARRWKVQKKEAVRNSFSGVAHAAHNASCLIEQADSTSEIGSEVRSESCCESASCRCRFERRTPEPVTPERDQNSRRSRDRLVTAPLERSLLPLSSPPLSIAGVRATRPLVATASSIQSLLGVWLT